ncbi:hypothetical protein L7F22_020131 [Adiantum nelumboides]|nr:hypothetical protein [Adiantum nelumboides]
MCNIEEDKVLQFETVAVDYISNLDAIVHGVLTSSTQKLNRLSELRASLQQKESLLRLEGSNVVTKKIKKDILLFEQHLDELHRQVPCDIDEIKDVKADLNASKRMLRRLEDSTEMKNLALEMEIEQNECVVLEIECKDEDNTIYALGSCVACGECLGSAHVVEYEVKEEYTDNHAADKHSKIGHMLDEEMEDGVKFYDVEMHKAATRSFQGMSNEVQLDKLDEDKDTTTGAHEGVNDRREGPNHEVKVDDENLLSKNKDGDKDSIKEDPKVDTGGNKVSKEEDPKVDIGVSKELLEECLPTDEEVHKAQFLGDKDPPIGVDVNEHTPGLKAWWLDEPTVIERNPTEDIPASKDRLIILDVNEVVLKGWSKLPKDEWELNHALQGIRVNNFCLVKLRPGAQDFLEALAAREDCEIWRDSFKCVPYVDAKFWQKPVFLKKLRRVWEKHIQFNASNTILLEDTRYKSLKNDYDNRLSICSFDLEVELEGSSYLANIVEP